MEELYGTQSKIYPQSMDERLKKLEKRTWLFSDSLIKRSFAVLGYNTIGGLLVYLALILISIPVTIVLVAIK